MAIVKLKCILVNFSLLHCLTKVDTSGRKYTAEITPDGIDWHNKDPKNKVVAEFDNDNNVVYRKAPVTENGPVYPCRDCKSLGDTSTANTESEVRVGHKAGSSECLFFQIRDY